MGGRHMMANYRYMAGRNKGGRKMEGRKTGGRERDARERVIKHAKALDDVLFKKLLDFVDNGRHPLRDRVMVLLSFKAGLRAQEIAGLDWTAVCNAEGVLSTENIIVGAHIAKRRRERTVPMHPDLYRALRALREMRPGDRGIIYGARCKYMTPNNVTVYFHELYKRLGFEGCSSHSGRRSFITALARKANLHGCSLKDVQLVAGHRHLDSTERYLEPSDNIGRLVAAI
jgi:integrase